MTYDRCITITVGASRKSINWTRQTLTLSDLYEKLKSPVKGEETLNVYGSLSKAEQDKRKDVGGFVAGVLSAPRRKSKNVQGRDILTLDLDNIPPNGSDTVLRQLEMLQCGYCVYSTRKHHAAAPRLRVLLPLNRTVTAEEYEPLARKAADMIGIQYADPTTFEAARLMYWPSICSDGQYLYKTSDLPLIDADALLATYENWRNVLSWPQVPGSLNLRRLASKQGDPEDKPGIVGAFCRCYDITAAMDDFIPGMYAPCAEERGRYTFSGGSTTGGAVIYDNGKFLYSHHATDPCSGKLVNSFDMVRLHRFSDLDDAADDGTPTIRLPSYTAMLELANADKSVSGLLNQERYQSAMEDFAGILPAPKPTANAENTETPTETAVLDLSWMDNLECHKKTGIPLPTIDNALLILNNDPHLAGKIGLNVMAEMVYSLSALPWNPETSRRAWTDADTSGLYWYLEKAYQITGQAKIDAAFALTAKRNEFNDLRDYLASITGSWDGIPRLDSLFIDYLGAEDTSYTRAVTRKAFTAAVARVMQPGTKFDSMVILSGPQGIGKSSLLNILAKEWFNDGIRSFEGKEASEMLRGAWLVEIGELDAFRRSDVSRIKQFLSQRADIFRESYGRHTAEHPRRCVFFGTTNQDDYLIDATGNRRFWPVDVGLLPPKKSVWNQLPAEIDQIWAEAIVRWQAGEPLYLTGALEAAAKEQHERHREEIAYEGKVIDFVNRKTEKDWSKVPLDLRRDFWARYDETDDAAQFWVERERICAAEVWTECFNARIQDMKRYEAVKLNEIISRIPGWEKSKSVMRFGPHGVCKGFVKGGTET